MNNPESLSNQMKLLRMDFITYTNKIEHEVKMVKKEIRGIKEALRLMLKKRPDQTTKVRFKHIMDEINKLNLDDIGDIIKDELRRKK